MIFGRFIEWVKSLFGIEPKHKDKSSAAAAMEQEYRKIDAINFASIFANKLANLTLADSTMDVGGEAKTSARALLLKETLAGVWAKNDKITTQTLGTGGRLLLPFASNGRVQVDVIAQERLYICEMDGDRITDAVLLADCAEVGRDTYYRWVYYSLSSENVLTVRNRATKDSGQAVGLDVVPAWAGITEEYTVANVDRMPFAFLRCPVDNREERDVFGVAITYGSEEVIAKIKEHLKIIVREYKLTRPMLGLSSMLWKKKPDGSKGIYEVRSTAQDSEDPFVPVDDYVDEGRPPWMIYAPPIRDASMYNRLDRLFELLEKCVGTSRGILTARETANATATEIRAANHDTFALVDKIRAMWEKGMDDLLYAVDLLAELNGITPAGNRGRAEILWDWDMSMYESSTETFTQRSELHAAGLISDAEHRQWVMGGTLEENQKAIDEIRAAKPKESELDRLIRTVQNPVDNPQGDEE